MAKYTQIYQHESIARILSFLFLPFKQTYIEFVTITKDQKPTFCKIERYYMKESIQVVNMNVTKIFVSRIAPWVSHRMYVTRPTRPLQVR